MREKINAWLERLITALGLRYSMHDLVPEISEKDLMRDLDYGRD